MAHPCRDDGRPVVFRHLAVGPVQLRRVPVAAGVVYRRRAVVGHEHRGHPAEVVVHVHVRPDPVPRLLVGERLHVGVLAVRQSRDEQVGVHGFTRVRVDDVRRVRLIGTTISFTPVSWCNSLRNTQFAMSNQQFPTHEI